MLWRTVPGWVYICPSYPGCDTFIRCHDGTDEPLGTMAGPRLRRLRGEAHRAFDPLWNAPGTEFGRDFAYQVAGQVLGISDFHIGDLDEAGCRGLIARIDEIDAAIDQPFDEQRRRGSEGLGSATLELLSDMFQIGSAAERRSINSAELARFPNVAEHARLAGLVAFDAATGLAHLSPYGAQTLMKFIG